MVMIKILNKRFLPLKRRREKAYATIVQDSTEPMTFPAKMINVFKVKRKKGCLGLVSAVTKLSQWKYLVGKIRGVK